MSGNSKDNGRQRGVQARHRRRLARHGAGRTCRWRSSRDRSGLAGKRARLPSAHPGLAAGRDGQAARRRRLDRAAAAASRRHACTARPRAGAARGEGCLRRAGAGPGRDGRRRQHMAGVAANLRARLAEECESEGYDRMTRRDQLPLPAALSLLARERMSGEPASRIGRKHSGGLARTPWATTRRRALAEMADLPAYDQEAYHPRRPQAAGGARPGRGRGRSRAERGQRGRRG